MDGKMDIGSRMDMAGRIDIGGRTRGWISGFIGMLIFSGSLPATRLAVMEFDPVFLTMARGAIAGICAGLILLLLPQRKPQTADMGSIALVAFGCVFGFPLLTALALRYVTSAHSLAFIGLLPLATAIFAVARAQERPGRLFWLFSGLGAICVVGFSLSADRSATPAGDILMLAAIAVCGLGYAEGAVVARRLGGWQTICWALVFALPYMFILTLYTFPRGIADIGPMSWAGLAYVSLFSMLIGFFFWYSGLARGGISAVGQLQLLQPFFGLSLAALLLHEPVGWTMIGTAVTVALCVAAAKRFAS